MVQRLTQLKYSISLPYTNTIHSLPSPLLFYQQILLLRVTPAGITQRYYITGGCSIVLTRCWTTLLALKLIIIIAKIKLTCFLIDVFSFCLFLYLSYLTPPPPFPFFQVHLSKHFLFDVVDLLTLLHIRTYILFYCY